MGVNAAYPSWHPHADVWLLVIVLSAAYAITVARIGPRHVARVQRRARAHTLAHDRRRQPAQSRSALLRARVDLHHRAADLDARPQPAARNPAAVAATADDLPVPPVGR